MTQLDQIVAAYLATWNVRSEQERRALLHQHWSPTVRYVDPLTDVAGHDGITAVISGVHTKFPGLVFSKIGEADAHHQQMRFRWGLGPLDGEPLAIGFDVLVLDDEGRIQDVRGFLDVVPA